MLWIGETRDKAGVRWELQAVQTGQEQALKISRDVCQGRAERMQSS